MEKEGFLSRFSRVLVMQRLANELDARARKRVIDVAAVREAFHKDLRESVLVRSETICGLRFSRHEPLPSGDWKREDLPRLPSLRPAGPIICADWTTVSGARFLPFCESLSDNVGRRGVSV
jgi:hypothetical protein